MVTASRSIIIHGDVDASATRALREAASGLGVGFERTQGASAFARWLDNNDPLAVFIAMESTQAPEACLEIRHRPRLAHAPIFALSEARGDVSFLELYQWGGDDVIGADVAGLSRRLRLLLSNPPPSEPSKSIAEAVVAGPDPQWRAITARAIANAGVGVRFAGSATDAAELSDGAKFVVAEEALGPEGAVKAIVNARSSGSLTPWVVVAVPKRVGTARADLSGVKSVAVIDAFAPPENALFAANELAAAYAADNRASARLLFGAAVGFRVAGRDVDEIGFTYNVSAGGMYVRTLSPIDAGEEVWLELRPPRSDRRVRLVGQVAWRRLFGRNERAIVPPGFGVRLTGGLARDIESWCAGCAALADAELALPDPPALRLRASSATPAEPIPPTA